MIESAASYKLIFFHNGASKTFEMIITFCTLERSGKRAMIILGNNRSSFWAIAKVLLWERMWRLQLLPLCGGKTSWLIYGLYVLSNAVTGRLQLNNCVKHISTRWGLRKKLCKVYSYLSCSENLTENAETEKNFLWKTPHIYYLATCEE